MDSWTMELDKLASETAVMLEHMTGEARELGRKQTAVALQSAVTALLALRAAARTEADT